MPSPPPPTASVQLTTGGLVYATTKVVDPIGTAADEANRKGTKISFKDVDERIAAVVEYNFGSPITTTYDYDPLGQITTVRDNKGNTTTVEYDLVGKRTAITNPDTGRTEYGYDANGNMTSKLSANYQRGKEIKYDYIFNRLVNIIYPYTTTVKYDYGRHGCGQPGREDHKGHRRIGSGGEVLWQPGRDYQGSEERRGQDAPRLREKVYTTDYVFDSFGRMNQMTYPDGETLYYSYDNGGLLSSSWGTKLGNRYNYINTLTYDEFGQRRHISYGNGVLSDYSYDDKTRRLATLATVTPDQRSIQNLSYEYDLVGNILKVQNLINTPTNTALPAGPLHPGLRVRRPLSAENRQRRVRLRPGQAEPLQQRVSSTTPSATLRPSRRSRRSSSHHWPSTCRRRPTTSFPTSTASPIRMRSPMPATSSTATTTTAT